MGTWLDAEAAAGVDKGGAVRDLVVGIEHFVGVLVGHFVA